MARRRAQQFRRRRAAFHAAPAAILANPAHIAPNEEPALSSTRPSRRRKLALAAAAIVGACAVALSLPASRRALVAAIPPDRLVQLNGLRHGYGVDRDVRGEDNASDHAPAWIVLDL